MPMPFILAYFSEVSNLLVCLFCIVNFLLLKEPLVKLHEDGEGDFPPPPWFWNKTAFVGTDVKHNLERTFLTCGVTHWS